MHLFLTLLATDYVCVGCVVPLMDSSIPPFESSDNVPQPVGSVIHVNHCSTFQSVSLNLVMIYNQAGA